MENECYPPKLNGIQQVNQKTSTPSLLFHCKILFYVIDIILQRYYGRRKNCYSIAVRAVRRAWQNATAGRKKKKGVMRRVRIKNSTF